MDVDQLLELFKRAIAETSIEGLDYLDEDQAAHYCRLGVSTFREQVRFLRIPRLKMLGTRRIVYRRADLQRAVEWHGCGNADPRKIQSAISNSSGPMGRGSSAPKVLVERIKFPKKTRKSSDSSESEMFS